MATKRLYPRFGVDYKTAKEVCQAYRNGEKFILKRDPSVMSQLVSISDFLGEPVELHYDKERCYTVYIGTEK